MSGIPAGAGQLLGKRLGKFEILALLALGGTAEIYLARIGGAAGFEKYVVVKCLHDHLADDPEFVKMFLDEARLAAHLDHSNIVQTMELGQHENRYYMVMEFLAGLSLAMIVRRANERLPDMRIPVPLVLNVLAQSCAGLHYAHEKAMNGRPLGIVHRDISPQNLVISFEGVVKIVDFGIAKAELRETRTRSGTIKGKFAYMSPEQCVANNVDRRTDVFALGVIAHELLTGRRLFKHASPYETYQAVMECDVKPPSTLDHRIDPAIDSVIMRALTKDKADRYPTAEAFGDALLGYLHHRGIGSGPGDVSRFFDAHFGQEIDEHSARMRELISGRDISIDTGVTWGSDDGDDDAKSGGNAITSMLDELGGGSRVEDDDELSTERTRIESNPLDRVNELDRLAERSSSSAAGPAPGALFGMSPPGAMPLGMPPSGPLLPPTRFPDPASLPTVIAVEPMAPAAVPSSAANAPTIPPTSDGFAHAATGPAPSPGKVPAAADGFSHAPTAVAPQAQRLRAPPLRTPPSGSPSRPPHSHSPAGLASLPSPPPSIASSANAPTSLAAPIVADEAQTQISPFPDDMTTEMPRPPSHAQRAASNGASDLAPHQRPLRTPGSSSAPPPPLFSTSSAPGGLQGELGPSGYPVMNAELSSQIATGASVFPSEPRGPALHGGGPRTSERSEPSTVPPALGSHPGPRGAEQPPVDGYLHMGQYSAPDGAPLMMTPPGGHPVDPQRAAQLLSPVGQHYDGQIDWSAAASAPARAAPKWLLALLFIGALGIALGLTIAIARLLA